MSVLPGGPSARLPKGLPDRTRLVTGPVGRVRKDVYLKTRTPPPARELPDPSFFAVGEDGYVFASSDGSSWFEMVQLNALNLFSVAYGGGEWLAVGNRSGDSGAVGVMFASPDGRTWEERDPGTTETLRDVKYHDGLWVAACGNETMLHSTDGETWSAGTLSLEFGGFVRRVKYHDGLWVGVAGSAGFVTSADGKSWSEADSGSALDVTYANSTWAACGNNGSAHSSPDGSTWTQEDSAAGTVNTCIRRASGLWCFLRENGSQWTSSTIDGSFTMSGSGRNLLYMISRGGVLYAVGDGLASVSSDGGQTWSDQSTSAGVKLLHVAHIEGEG